MHVNEWRYSFNRPRLWIVDYRLSVILIAWLMYIHLWSFFLAIVCILFFLYIEKVKRITLEAALRHILAKWVNFIRGTRRPARKSASQLFFIDNEYMNETVFDKK